MVKINFLDHAQKRCKERKLNRSAIKNMCLTVAPAMVSKRPLKFRIGDTTVVAKKRNNRVIDVVTAWKLS